MPAQDQNGSFSFDLLWHYQDEPCTVQRTLLDLNSVRTNQLNNGVIHLHTSRSISSQRAAALEDQDPANAATQQVTGSTSRAPGTGRGPKAIQSASNSDPSQRSSSSNDRAARGAVAGDGFSSMDASRHTANSNSDKDAPDSAQLAGKNADEPTTFKGGNLLTVQNASGEAEEPGNLDLGSNSLVDATSSQMTMTVQFKSVWYKLLLDKVHWALTKWLVEDVNWSFIDVIKFLRDHTNEKILKDKNMKRFDKLPTQIIFHPRIHFPGERGRYAQFDEYGDTQIERLDDLFPKSDNPAELPLTVEMFTNGTTARGDATKKFCENFAQQIQYYQIGELKPSGSSEQSHADNEHAVFGCFLKSDHLKLCLVSTWHANGQTFGYLHASAKIPLDPTPKTIPEGTNIDSKYGTAVRNTSDVERFLLDRQNDAVRQDMAFTNNMLTPTYTFHESLPIMEGSRPKRWPKDPV